MKVKSQIRLSGCLLSGLLLSAPTFAQTSAPTAPAAPAERVAPAEQRTPGAAAPSAPRGVDAPAARAANTTMQTGSLQYLTEHRAGLWRASKLDGVDVYNEQNDKIGDITEVLLDETGRIEAVVIGVGGFLGIGQRNVAVPFNALKWQMTAPVPTRTDRLATETRTAPAAGRETGSVTAPTERSSVPPAPRMTERTADRTARDAPERAILAGASKDQLKDAPEFKYAR
ncbi:MAG: PRC-barrel domain-containing protein [Beijerinckiaceae bacterium]|nr:PRC-barrel domain-containing protein [Beijerinckiaceae bacterium]